MIDKDLIKKHFYTSNYITLCEMYLNEYKKPESLQTNNLKNYNPGHLGSSVGTNFILSNLNYFLNKNNLRGKIVIGTGHSGVSLLSNLWLNGTLNKYYDKYTTDKEGLNNLIKDFGKNIRSEINPEYPGVIYDGGELGYSLAVSYGYAINSDADIIPCIIGDGEAETGTLSSSWYLNKLLNTKSKVLPIINLNKYKMGSNSYLSRLNNKELNEYFNSLGYNIKILNVEDYDNIEDIILQMQQILSDCTNIENPLIIFKSPKGWTIPDLENIKVENTTESHKNPLISFNKEEKLKILKEYLKKYYYEIFNENNQLNNELLKYFSILETKDEIKEIHLPNIEKLNLNKKHNIEYAEEYLIEFLKNNNITIFSPDEIYSNKLGGISKSCFEILNENVLQGLMQGYIQAGNSSLFIGYEGFMPIISSMVSQYWKYLLQKKQLSFVNEKSSLNYFLTSTCWENTYSHQNPSFVNDLLMKDDEFYNILYPKDGNNFIKCMEESLKLKDTINIITMSKRENTQYSSYKESNTTIDILYDVDNPDIILCATGDYMLSHIKLLSQKLLEENPNIKLKIVYITNPKILDINSKKALTNDEFNYYFNDKTPVLYLFNGYTNVIKGLLYERNRNFKVYGYNDNISIFGGINENLNNNGLNLEKLLYICYDEIRKNKEDSKTLKLRR